MQFKDKELFQKFKKLPRFYKQVVELFALSHEPLNTSMGYKCLQRLGARPIRGILNSSEIGLFFNNLVSEGYLTRVNRVDFVISETIENEIVKELFGSPEFELYAETLQTFLPIFSYSSWSGIPLKRYYRSIRIALLDGDFKKVTQYVSTAKNLYGSAYDANVAYSILLNPLDEKWLLRLPNEVISFLGMQILEQLFENCELNNDFFEFLKKNKISLPGQEGNQARDLLKWRYLFEGNLLEVLKMIELEPEKDSRYHSFLGAVNFLEGKNDSAIARLEETNKLYRKETRKKGNVAPYNSAQFMYLALLKNHPTQNNDFITKYLKDVNFQLPLATTFKIILAAQQNEMDQVKEYFEKADFNGFAKIFLNYANFWVFRQPEDIDIQELETLYKNAQKSGLKYIQLLIADLLEVGYNARYKNSERAVYFKEEKNNLFLETPIVSIIDLIPVVEPWERSINALLRLSNQFEGIIPTEAPEQRIIWLVDFNKGMVEAKEQRIGKSGKWTKGKTATDDHLINLARGKNLPNYDKAVIQTLGETDNHYRYRHSSNSFPLTGELIQALSGHPHLYMNDARRTSVEIVKEQPQLLVEETEKEYELKFNVSFENSGVVLKKETPTRYKAIEVTEEHLQIARTMGSGTIRIPKEMEGQLTKIVKGLAKVVSVQSGLLADDIDVKKVPSDPRPHLHLLPIGDGFQLEMFVKPFGEHSPYYKPNDGGRVILTEILGERLQTERDLEVEKKLAVLVIKSCPSLGTSTKDLSKIWLFESPQECLEVLSEIQPFKEADKVVIEWPKGERLKIKKAASFEQLSMKIKSDTDWFEASGTLQIGEDLVMDMKELLGLLDNSDSRFVQLKDGEFLALTERFAQQLKAMQAYSTPSKDGLKFHPLAAFAFDELSAEAKDLEADAAWRAQLKKLKDAEEKKVELPSAFKAELRPYQKEGFDWLMKLANWGVGACLADDMGLGKTIQGLAAILTRAKDGPTLVVCPASVRINWQREAEKFAPDMFPIQFGDGDRQHILDNLKPFDMLITSYGLMQTEEEAFSKIKFATIVLDEAQAIKNHTAKRSKAAMELDSDFKIITTGTPIENHLGELWNLFRFINPGLLGSLERFRSRFALPIEKYGDDDRREQLKKLIRPFILRRRKSEVLLELPEKTEIVLNVELSVEEKAFYEALRQSALEKLKDVQPGDGQSHLRILAEITRLRQACCNPLLVSKTTKVKSSKLALFNETISELLENGHKVLVFSQFVQHLKILEKSLKSKKVSYQYLDGSTSQKNRQKAIDAFQGGDGDVFLISLKAGGVGLNLTAADYVIHMDPWWNPAVEDQASDRAHRIGQKRPVTIYRFVAEGSIEEKIVKLHDQKRDLADSLLDGTNTGNRLNANDLMDLIREGMK